MDASVGKTLAARELKRSGRIELTLTLALATGLDCAAGAAILVDFAVTTAAGGALATFKVVAACAAATLPEVAVAEVEAVEASVEIVAAGADETFLAATVAA